MSLDETIHLEEHQERWALWYEEERQVLLNSIGESISGIEHFGSTSIPGMVAKPMIDILLGVMDMGETDGIIQKLKSLGYEFLGESGIPGRLYFRKRGQNAINVHVVGYGEPIWDNNLILRDYLRVHAQEAERYGDLKREIVRNGGVTLLDYSDQKSEFVSRLLERAQFWKRNEHNK